MGAGHDPRGACAPPNPALGFVRKSIPHITLKSIAHQAALEAIFADHQPVPDRMVRVLSAGLAKVPDEARQRLAPRLHEKEERAGKKAVTERDRLQWWLPNRSSKTPDRKWEEGPFDSGPDRPEVLSPVLPPQRRAGVTMVDPRGNEVPAVHRPNGQEGWLLIVSRQPISGQRMAIQKQLTGMRGVFLVAAELSRLGYIVSPTSRNARGADLLVTDAECKKAFSVSVKTNARTFDFWLVDAKARAMQSPSYVYVFVNLRKDRTEYFVVPSEVVAGHVHTFHSSRGTVWYDFKLAAATPYKDNWALFAGSAKSFENAEAASPCTREGQSIGWAGEKGATRLEES